VAGLGSRAFTWSCTGTAAGSLTLGATVSGTDANTGGALSATAAPVAVTVQTAAALAATLDASPTVVSTGQLVTLRLHVTNTGGATAAAVAPTAPAVTSGNGAAATLFSGPEPASSSIPGGAVQTYTWTYTATAAGTLSFQATASGTDSNSGLTIGGTPAVLPTVLVQQAATLAATIAAAPATVSTGREITLTLTVNNTGEAPANGVAPTAPVLTSGNGATAALTSGPTPASASIPGGGSQGFVWRYAAGSAGTLSMQATASGTDANSAASRTATPAAPAPVAIRPALTATLVLGVPSGGTFTVTMTVTAAGGAVTGVAPGALSVAAGSTGAAALLSGPTPATTVDLTAGGSQAFTWSYGVTTPGDFTLTGLATGTDPLSAAVVSSPLATSNLVPLTLAIQAASVAGTALAPEIALVADDPFRDGTAVLLLQGWRGSVLAGPSRDGRRLARLDPAGGAPPEELGLAAGVDAGPTPAAGPWRGSATAPTLGAAGCSPASATCGPDGEEGVALLAAGALGGAERLFAAGLGGGGRYLYGAEAWDSPMALAWLDLRAIPATGALAALAAVPGSPDRLYLARQGGGPALVALQAWPGSVGLDARPGSDLVDLGLDATPEVMGTGVSTLADRPAGPCAAGGGGILCATRHAPRPFGEAPGDWAPATPSAAAWSARLPVLAPPGGRLLPRDRPVAAMASFGSCGAGPCLFAARNVQGTSPPVVAQLWRCDPAADGSCPPQAWRLVAPEGTGDALLTQLGEPTNEAASLLVATSRWLYLGFDNGARGVQLWRAPLAPSAAADFRGRGGCTAGTPGCEPLGGPGLGDPARLTRILDARAMEVGGAAELWLVAGDGAGAARIFRVPE